jgi:hypothetical protein
MSWFRHGPAINADPLDKAKIQLDQARERRKAALKNLMEALYKTPIEIDLAQLGDDLTSADREAK